MARRIAAILLLEPALDEAYATAKSATWEWAAGEGCDAPAPLEPLPEARAG